VRANKDNVLILYPLILAFSLREKELSINRSALISIAGFINSNPDP